MKNNRITRIMETMISQPSIDTLIWQPSRLLSALKTLGNDFTNRFVWQCPSKLLSDHYSQHISNNHLDVGVGTGYFLDHVEFLAEQPRLALMDADTGALHHAARRLQRYQPETLPHDALQPLPSTLAPFDSVGVNFLLHCLPGTMADKVIVFDHLAAHMKPGAVLFGSTVLQDKVTCRSLARGFMQRYNRRGVFFNQEDDLATLRVALNARFDQVNMRLAGCVLLFTAYKSTAGIQDLDAAAAAVSQRRVGREAAEN